MPVVPLSTLKTYFENGKVLTESEYVDLIDTLDNANNYVPPNHTGDVTSIGDGITTIGNNKVTNAKLQDMGPGTIKGNNALGTEDPKDLTKSQVQAMINGSGLNSDTVDGKHNTDFLARYSGSGITIAANGGSIGNDIQATGGGAAGLAFHRPSAYAVNFGLDTDNQLKIGGWTMGNVAHRIWHDGIMSGSSFPTPSFTGQLFYRSDLKYWCFWNGTYWLTVSEFVADLPLTYYSSGMWVPGHPIKSDYNVFITKIAINYMVSTNSNSSNYWNIITRSINLPLSSSVWIRSTYTGSAVAGTYYQDRGTIEAIPSVAPGWIDFSFTKTGSPGLLTAGGACYYRFRIG